MGIEGLKNIIYVGILVAMALLGYFSDQLGFWATPSAFTMGFILATIYPYKIEIEEKLEEEEIIKKD